MLRSQLRSRRSRREFVRSQKALKSGEMLCGTFERGTGRPLYFSMPSSADQEAVALVAFRLREGRDQSPAEKSFKQYSDRWLAKHRSEA